MPLKTDTIEEPQINLTPMVDIVFLLIIFFMVGTRFAEMERQYEIQLPTVATVEPLTALPDDVVVNVSQEGTIHLNNEPRTLEELHANLVAAKAHYADQGVVIRGDGEATYQHVMNVLAVCKQAQITNVSLANRPQSEDAE